jgi:alkanesulfonate monooxygenase SsuD/methylene tetrahydromethanopterin reductase-like flavin-dependent oxidoreductase (luciferase family)
MELGVISLSDVQTDPATGRPFPYQQRVEEIVGYATLADRTGLDVFALGEHHTLDFATLDLLLQLRDSDHVTWSGKVRPPLHHAPVTPRAVQQPLPVWLGVGGSPESAERAGRLGLPMVLGYIGRRHRGGSPKDLA